jgi:hypothetical protein
VRVDGTAVRDANATLGPGTFLCQVGKRRWGRVIVPS